MFRSVSFFGARVRLATTHILTRWGFQEDTFILILAFGVGIVTAAAAVAFHLLINAIRNALYGPAGSHCVSMAACSRSSSSSPPSGGWPSA